MAKFEIRFLDATCDEDYIETHISDQVGFDGYEFIEIKISGNSGHNMVYLDKSTAIKFAKTLRTEINKITESEADNG